MSIKPSLSQNKANVVIVDDFFENPNDVRNFATGMPYVREDTRYKVQRSQERYLFSGVKERFEALLGKKITVWEAHGFNGVFQLSVSGDKVVYHSDHQSYAGVVYLTPDAPPQSGTVLIRSKGNKLRCPEEAVKANLSTELASRQMYGDGNPGKLLDPTAWEIVDVIGNRYNRLAIWNARLAHAGMNYFGNNINDGRLVQMYFFDCG